MDPFASEEVETGAAKHISVAQKDTDDQKELTTKTESVPKPENADPYALGEAELETQDTKEESKSEETKSEPPRQHQELAQEKLEKEQKMNKEAKKKASKKASRKRKSKRRSKK